MKKLAAGIAVIALVMTAQFAIAKDTVPKTATQSGTAMTMTGDMCTGKTSASASSSSMDASAMAACSASASASSSSSVPTPNGDQKIKTKSNIKND